MAANPKCINCNHPQSFHRKGEDGGCQVGPCECKEFSPALDPAPQPAA